MSDKPQNINDDSIFDQLVDGELSATERHQLLASLDDSHDGWRRCALAFLEAQSWGHQFKQLAAEVNEQPSPQPASSPPISRTQSVQWFAIAAGVMLAFTVGWLVRSPTPSNPSAGKIVAIDSQESPSVDELPRDVVSDNDAVTLYVRDTSGKNQRIRVPLVGGANHQGQAESQLMALPAVIREQLQDGGFDLKRRRRFAPMFFEQNERVVPMVVPVDDTYIVPVSRPIY